MKKERSGNPILFFCLLQTIVLISWFSMLPLFSFAAVRYVPGQHSSIQAAIDASSDGDEIVVSPGTYYENVNIDGKNIILRSTDPTSATVVATTIIDGSSTGTVVTYAGTEDETGALSGFTITNGNAQDGAGIYGNGSLATIQYNCISTNTATGPEYKGNGAGIRECDGTIQYNIISANSANYCGGGLLDCGGLIQYNTISGNSAGYGAGLKGCNGTIQYNTIFENTADSYGGGLFICEGFVQNNTIFNNSAQRGGGIKQCDGIVQNNLIYGNYAENRGGGLDECNGVILNNTVYDNLGESGGGDGIEYCRGLIMNCIIWGNDGISADNQIHRSSTPFYCCIQGWHGEGRGNINTDPKFIDAPNGDFHLTSDSLCIDAGNKYYLYGDYIADLDGNCRVAGTAIDLGCYEYGAALDIDGDLLADDDETTHSCILDNSDTDGDGLKDGIELIRGTDPALSNSPAAISIPAQYTSIQEALFLAFPGEEIILSPGTYHENLHFLGKNLTLRSINPLDEDTVASTTISGDSLFSVIMFQGTEDESSAVKGLTIRDAATGSRGGIRGNGTLAAIENNRIVNNSAEFLGGGISSCNGIIQNNIISGNASFYAGGLHWCCGIIQNNLIYNNSASYGGGACYVCFGTIQNNLIYNNTAALYGGALQACYADIRNNVIWENSATTGTQLHSCDLPSYCCIQDWVGGGTGNITDDPLLVDPANGDFHLQTASPCIDAGGNVVGVSQDFEGDSRPHNAVIWEYRGDNSDFDIGADEFIGTVPVPVEGETAYSFDTSAGEWGYSTVTGYSLPQFDSSGGMINISSGDDSVNRFGFWQSASGAVTYEADQVYRARYAIQTNQITPDNIPTIRLRFTTENFTGSAAQSIVSLGSFSYSPPTAGTKEYRLLYYPAVADNLGFAFDMLDFSPDEYGTISLESVVVETFPRLVSSGTPVRTYDSESDFGAWLWSANFSNPAWNGATSAQSGGTISIQSAGQPQAAFWQSPANDLDYVADKLYRVTFTMSRGSGDAAATMPWCRIRCFNEDGQMSQEFNINNGNSGAAMPPESPSTRDYEVYWQTPDLPASPSTDEDGFRIAVDMLNFGAGETGTHILDTVIIEYSDIPAYTTP